MRQLVSLYNLDRAAVQDLLQTWGQPAYRARQLWAWLYEQLATTFDEMSNLPKSLRQRLAGETTIGVPRLLDTHQSVDGETRKDLLELHDGETVETVLMRYERRRTACISTQVGCSIGCTFCATGQAGFERDLSAGEIVAQVLHFARILRVSGDRLSNVVLMGMGEPLLNYEATLSAIHRLIDPQGFGMGQRHITLSTAGVVPGIDRLAKEGLQISLAVSLHAATDALRDELVPLNRRYDLDALFEACYRYFEQTGRRISFEWALIAGVNDTPEQARALAARLSYTGGTRPFRTHVNLIPLNPTEQHPGQPPTTQEMEAFQAILDRHRIPHTLRVRRGDDIQAGCGQLRQRSRSRG